MGLQHCFAPRHSFANNNKSGEAVKVGSPSQPENKNNQFLEPTNNYFRTGTGETPNDFRKRMRAKG